MYVRKEALLSSQIEGTQSSLSELLLFEADLAPGAPLDDVVEVSNYVAAMNHGLNRLRDDFPISTRLVREIHAVLLLPGAAPVRQQNRASFGAPRTGLAAHGRATRPSFLPRPIASRT